MIWPPHIRTNSMFYLPLGSQRPSHHLARLKKGLIKEKNYLKYLIISQKDRPSFEKLKKYPRSLEPLWPT
jgi:hypothetical protein